MHDSHLRFQPGTQNLCNANARILPSVIGGPGGYLGSIQQLRWRWPAGKLAVPDQARLRS